MSLYILKKDNNIVIFFICVKFDKIENFDIINETFGGTVMEELRLTHKMEKEFVVLGVGSEGVVYKYKNQAIKMFKSGLINNNKLQKIKLLHNMDLEDFQLPKKLYLNKVYKPVAYSMDYVDSDKTVQCVLQSSRLSLRQKIVYLEKVEYLVKNAHYNNIVFNDLNLFNFLVDENDTVKVIDTDNFKVKEYESDINPSFFTDLYNNNIGTKISENTDKFSLTLHFFKDLINRRDINEQKLLDDYNYIEELIDRVDAPNEFKDFLYQQLFGKKRMRYPAEYFEMISNDNEQFLKLK